MIDKKGHENPQGHEFFAYKYHKNGSKPQGHEVFVFGSNLAGIHGAGAALEAYNSFGAIYSVGVGPMGKSYAIPTKDANFRVLPTRTIKNHVNDFLTYVDSHPESRFFVTAIGTGYAGYSHSEMACLFEQRDNISYPEEWKPFFESRIF